MSSHEQMYDRYAKLDTATEFVADAYVSENQPDDRLHDRLLRVYLTLTRPDDQEEDRFPPGVGTLMKRWVLVKLVQPVAFAMGNIFLGAARVAGLFVRSITVSAASFLFQFLIRPLIVGLATALGPLGIGILAGGTAAYVLYKILFPKEPGPIPQIGHHDEHYGVVGSRIGASRSTESPGTARHPRSMESPSESIVGKGTVGDVLSKRSERVKDAIAYASEKTGVSEAILTAFAYKESTFNPDAVPRRRNGTLASTAKGLFQFLEGTWKETVTEYGKRYGVPVDADPFDPYYNALMGAAYLKHKVSPEIEKVIANPSATDLYLGHFMGPSGGRQWLERLLSDPNRIAAWDYPKAAKSNEWVYYNKRTRRARTYSEIYTIFAQGIQSVEEAVKTELANREIEISPGVETTNPVEQEAGQSKSRAGSVGVPSKKPDYQDAFMYKNVAFGA